MKKMVQELLEIAGIQPNGPRPWDIQIYNEEFYPRIIRHQNLGLGESYMENWWDCQQLDEFMFRLLDAGVEQKLKMPIQKIFGTFFTDIFNIQGKVQTLQLAEKHFDLGNDLFAAMLDDSMTYSSGYWKNASTLDEAQLNKMELACQKLMLKPGLKLLDVGCGWGGFAKYAAEHYGVQVTGITLSDAQKQYAKQKCRGLPIEIRLQDYHDLGLEKYDRIVSIGMLEFIGYKKYRDFMQIIHQHLTEDGIFLLHTIGSSDCVVTVDPWMGKYIFFNDRFPTIGQIDKAIEKLFIMEDWHNFGSDCDKTLLAWHKNFNENWDSLKNKYGESFRRMWNYYLFSFAGSFRARKKQIWQIILTKRGLRNTLPIRDL